MMSSKHLFMNSPQLSLSLLFPLKYWEQMWSNKVSLTETGLITPERRASCLSREIELFCGGLCRDVEITRCLHILYLEIKRKLQGRLFIFYTARDTLQSKFNKMLNRGQLLGNKRGSNEELTARA